MNSSQENNNEQANNEAETMTSLQKQNSCEVANEDEDANMQNQQDKRSVGRHIPDSQIIPQEHFKKFQEAKQTGTFDPIAQSSLFGNAAIDRKKEAFLEAQRWQQFKEQFLKTHLMNSETLLLILNRRAKQSQEAIKQIVTFFTFKRDKEVAYAKSMQCTSQNAKLDGAFRNFEKKESLYPQLSEILLKIDNIHDLQTNKILEFAEYLQKTIIEELFGQELKEYVKFQKRCTDQIAKFKSNFEKAQEKLDKRVGKHQKVYHQYMQLLEKKEKQNITNDNNNKKDFYNWELKLKKQTLAAIVAQKEYAYSIVEYWEEIQRLECTRLETIQRGLELYLSQHIKLYGKTKEQDEAIQKLAIFDAVQIGKKSQEIEQILSPEQVQKIKEFLNLPQTCSLTFKNVHEYFYLFSIPQFGAPIQKHRLVLKQYKAYKDAGKIGTSWKPIHVLLTIDKYLLLVDNDDDNIEKEKSKISFIKRLDKDKDLKADFLQKENEYFHHCETSYAKLKADKIMLNLKKNDSYGVQLYITETKPGLIFNSTNKYLIKFESKDCLEEFILFMQHQINKDILQQEDS